MATSINSNNTNVIFINNDTLVNLIPPIFNTCIHKCGRWASPYELVGLQWSELSSPDLITNSLVLELEGSMPSQTFLKHRFLRQHVQTPIPKSYAFSSTINKRNYEMCYLTVRI